MIATVWVKKLQEIMDLMTRFVSKHSTLPVLENVYINWSIDKLIFRGTDMEKYIQISLQCQIEKEWALTVNAKTFFDIVRSLDDEQVQLVMDETKDILFIRWINDNFSVKGIPATEYVAVPEVQDSNSLSLPAKEFSQWVAKVEYSVTERNFSPVLTWVLLRLKEQEGQQFMIFVWTDSYRLAEYKIPLSNAFPPVDIIIPKLTILDIKKVSDYFLEHGGQDIVVTFSDNLLSCSFELDDMKISTTSILVKGNFPDYDNENIIPRTFNTTIAVDKDLLDKAIKKISILTRDMNFYLDIQILDGKIILSSWETDKWAAKTEIPANIKWELLGFGVNGKYLAEFIKNVEDPYVTFNIVNWEKPFLAKDLSYEHYTYVVRPFVK